MDEVSNSNLAAKDLICLHVKEKKDKLKNELIKKQHVIELKEDLWPSHIINDTEAAVQILKERIDDVSGLIVPKNKTTVSDYNKCGNARPYNRLKTIE